MARKNLTLQLDEDVIQRAKVVAARRGTSVSGLVARELQDLVEEDARFEEAKERALEALGQATGRGGRRWSREALHER